jgi:RNA polymerase sigma-70 factor (ECF subfamily)
MTAEELVKACTERGDPELWEEFVRRFHRLIAGTVAGVARQRGQYSPELVDDLVQETFLRVSARDGELLRTFKAHHADAIFGYLKVVAANVARDHFKAARSAKRGSGQEESALDPLTPVSDRRLQEGSPEHLEKQVLIGQIDQALKRHSDEAHRERDRSIFWLYYRQGMTAQAIAALPTLGLTTKGVESLLLRLTRLVRDELSKQQVSRDEPGTAGGVLGMEVVIQKETEIDEAQ